MGHLLPSGFAELRQTALRGRRGASNFGTISPVVIVVNNFAYRLETVKYVFVRCCGGCVFLHEAVHSLCSCGWMDGVTRGHRTPRQEWCVVGDPVGVDDDKAKGSVGVAFRLDHMLLVWVAGVSGHIAPQPAQCCTMILYSSISASSLTLTYSSSQSDLNPFTSKNIIYPFRLHPFLEHVNLVDMLRF